MGILFRHIAALAFLVILPLHATVAQEDKTFLHTVTKGQGLYSISRMYGVTEAEIIALNPGSDVVIKVGQQLVIPQKKRAEEISAETPDEGGKKFHTIKTGETLYRLTVIYGLKAKEICDANPGLSAENFKVGQVIVIPEKKIEQETVLEIDPKVTEPNPLIGQGIKEVAAPVVEEAVMEQQLQCKTEHRLIILFRQLGSRKTCFDGLKQFRICIQCDFISVSCACCHLYIRFRISSRLCCRLTAART